MDKIWRNCYTECMKRICCQGERFAGLPIVSTIPGFLHAIKLMLCRKWAKLKYGADYMSEWIQNCACIVYTFTFQISFQVKRTALVFFLDLFANQHVNLIKMMSKYLWQEGRSRTKLTAVSLLQSFLSLSSNFYQIMLIPPTHKQQKDDCPALLNETNVM